jgi:hypothetical protein
VRRLRNRGRHPAAAVVALDAAELAAISRALTDGAAFLRWRAEQRCDACQANPLGACAEHVVDLEQALAYDELAAALNERPRPRRGGQP